MKKKHIKIKPHTKMKKKYDTVKQNTNAEWQKIKNAKETKIKSPTMALLGKWLL